MTIILFLLIFGVVVISHEFGHFLLAKANGIHVVEFSVGFGPKLFGFKKGDTEYTIRILPLGGACRFEGEDMSSEEGQAAELTDGAFTKASVWSRIAAVVAGPLFNFLLAFLFSLVIVNLTYIDIPVIQTVTEGGGAQEAGLEAGDKLLSIDGKNVYLYRDVVLRSMLSDGKSVPVRYERDGQEYTTEITPQYSETEGRYLYGFAGGDYVKSRGLEMFKYAAYEIRYCMDSTYSALIGLFTGKVGKDDVAGPVGIASVVGETYEASKSAGFLSVLMNMMYIAVLLSVNLGVLNLLPLPALDGGRLVFMLIEVIRGKPVPPEKEGIVHFAGMVVFMILAVFILFNDIARLFR